MCGSKWWILLKFVCKQWHTHKHIENNKYDYFWSFRSTFWFLACFLEEERLQLLNWKRDSVLYLFGSHKFESNIDDYEQIQIHQSLLSPFFLLFWHCLVIGPYIAYIPRPPYTIRHQLLKTVSNIRTLPEQSSKLNISL